MVDILYFSTQITYLIVLVILTIDFVFVEVRLIEKLTKFLCLVNYSSIDI